MKKETSIKMNVFSFIAAFIIVIYHARPIFYKMLTVSDLTQDTLADCYGYIACIAMSFFFLKSGFLLYRNADKTNIGEKLKRRVHTLVIPFLIWNFFAFVQQFVNAVILKNGTEFSARAIPLHFTLFPYNGALWYMFVIIVLSCFAPIVLKYKRHKGLIAFAAAVNIVLSVFIYGFKGLNVFFDTSNSFQTYFNWIQRFFRYLPCYIAGALLGMYGGDRHIQAKVSNKGRFLLAIASCLLSLIWIVFCQSIANYVMQFILFIQPVLLWLIVDDALFNYEREPEILKTSLLIYVSQSFFLPAAGSLFTKIAAYETWPPFLRNAVVLVMPFVSGVLLCCICFAFRKLLIACKMKGVLSVLTGNRG